MYRFLATGTLEERILQRQSHKKSLSSSIVDQDEDQIIKKFDLAMLKRLFKLEEETDSDTHDNLNVRKNVCFLSCTQIMNMKVCSHVAVQAMRQWDPDKKTARRE